ncbi:MAG TPA: Mur ligase family protein, partial [Thermoanaerobaculia bacterium]|nr:Mur ligase family protein [Thermoanaerobaculia bacterium]
MRLLDSRRLTGPNLLLDRAGAVVDVALAPAEVPAAIELWRGCARRLLEAVGWEREKLAARRFPGGASLAFTAPIDALYAATEVNEAAWAMAEAALAKPSVAPADLEAVAALLRTAIAAESNPALLALERAAAVHGVAFLADADCASVGLGAGSLAWPVRGLPDPAAVDWSRVRDVPVVLVTGTNGKTTTVRLLAAMLAVSGKVAGFTSTDRIEVGGKVLERGDYSGPGGARTLLRDPRVEAAVLETARGGILRRGLAVRSADAALVTNVAADHLGDLGVHDLRTLAEAKLVVARAVPPRGRLVLPAADRELAMQGPKSGGAPILWFGLDPAAPPIAAAAAG